MRVRQFQPIADSQTDSNQAIYGSLAVALILAALAVWFFHQQRAKALLPPDRAGITDKPSDDHGHMVNERV
jgi:hypothetical protein